DEIIVLPTGGSTIKGWVGEEYLQQLKLPEFHIYDRDTEQRPKYQKYVDQLNSNDNCLAKLTQKREMENYIHPKAIQEIQNIEIEIEDFIDVPITIAQKVHENNSEKPWNEVNEH